MKRIKVPKLAIPVPAYILLLPGSTTYYNSRNSDRIPAKSLYKYLTGKDPEVPKKIDKVAAEKDEAIREKRWDLTRD